jgi:hypothetical protein
MRCSLSRRSGGCGSSYAWLTNTVDASEGLVWGTVLVATAAMFVAALAVPEAFDRHGVLFGVAFSIVAVMQLALYALRARGDPDLLQALEHVGVVVGEEFDEFSRVHRAALTGQQFQSPDVEPVYVLFEDFTHVKFYRRSFFDVVEDEEGRFEGFSHVDDWVPQRLVTATGPNPLPR